MTEIDVAGLRQSTELLARPIEPDIILDEGATRFAVQDDASRRGRHTRRAERLINRDMVGDGERRSIQRERCSIESFGIERCLSNEQQVTRHEIDSGRIRSGQLAGLRAVKASEIDATDVWGTRQEID